MLSNLPPRNRKIAISCCAPAIFAGLTLAIFHSVLFQTGHLLPSSPSDDLITQFLPWREFGFEQIRRGVFPLWNPYIFGGTPYFAGFQSALLYPPNWLHLLLPLTVAIDWIIALQVFWAGYFTYLWCRGRHASTGGSILAGLMFMFSGPYFLHVYAGHLANLSVMIWTPLLLLAIDKLNETGSLHHCLLGAFAVTMQILGGHPQYLYYTGIATLCYTGTLAIRSPRRLALCGGYVVIFAGASLIGAVQLLTGVQAAGESVRSAAADYNFASMFALAPENILTFLTPGLFGGLRISQNAADTVYYFGRNYLWEMSVFVSVTGLILGLYGMATTWRKTYASIVMILITLALALGRHLPLYRFLYNYLPEYGHFRSVSKFIFLLALFVCALAAAGFDELVERRKSIGRLALLCALGAIALALTALAIAPSNTQGGSGPWSSMLGFIARSHEIYTPTGQYSDFPFIRSTQQIAADSIGWSSATLAAISVVTLATRYKPWAAYGLIILAAIELFGFARQNLTTSLPNVNYPQQWLDAIRSVGDDRVVNAPLPDGEETKYLDACMTVPVRNLWGYDPGVLKRYAQTIAASQNINPDLANQYLPIGKGTLGFFQMLRCRLALIWPPSGPGVLRIASPLPIAQIVPNWVVRPNRDDALQLINAKDFNPRRTVVLEVSPGIMPTAGAPQGQAQVIATSINWLEIRTTIPVPEMLLITDNYSTGWRIRPLETSSQSTYQILPANHTLMGIPLQAGFHHLRIEYLPAAFIAGKWISIFAVLGYGTILFGWLIRRR
jgi:hypothetical protein